MAIGRSEEAKPSINDYYETTISTYEPYIGHQEAKLLAERVVSDIKQFNAIKEQDGTLIIYKLLTKLDFIHKKILFEETIKRLNAIRCSIIETLSSHLSSEKALASAQECITHIVTHSKFTRKISKKLYSYLEDGIIDLLEETINPTISIKGDALEALEMELCDRIEKRIKSEKSTLVEFSKFDQHVFFDRARQQGMSVMESLNIVRENIVAQPVDEAYEDLMDRVYADWKATKSEEELSMMDYPLFKARMLLDLGLEEYITYLPTPCVTPDKTSKNNDESMLVMAFQSTKNADAEANNSNDTSKQPKLFVFEAADFLKSLVSRSLFGDSSTKNWREEPKADESKKSFTMS